tara:strand:- start:536 stop:712 length:177 start_codon:yes stop_codon:yes gene_type:complete
MTRGQMGAYKGIQKAEKWPGGLDIRAGNEMGFRSRDRRVKSGADKPGTFGMKLRNQRS